MHEDSHILCRDYLNYIPCIWRSTHDVGVFHQTCISPAITPVMIVCSNQIAEVDSYLCCVYLKVHLSLEHTHNHPLTDSGILQGVFISFIYLFRLMAYNRLILLQVEGLRPIICMVELLASHRSMSWDT